MAAAVARRAITRMGKFGTGGEQSRARSVVTPVSTFGCRNGLGYQNETRVVALCGLAG